MPAPYKANYSVTRKGRLAGSMQVVLEQISDKTFSYRMDTRVKWGLIHPRIQQQTRFTWKDGIVLPLSFQSTQKVTFYKRTESVEFNWQSMRATGRKKRADFELEIRPGMQDKLTIYLLLARALCRGENPINSDVVSGPVLKPYSYRLQGTELLETKLGYLETIHIRRGNADSEKQTDQWHAKEVRFLPVKLVYRKKDEVTTMDLIDISFSANADLFGYNLYGIPTLVANYD